MTATLYTNNLLSIDDRYIGQLMAITERGQVQNATATRTQTRAQFRPLIATATLGDAVQFEMPVYVSKGPADHMLNPDLIAAISEWLNT